MSARYVYGQHCRTRTPEQQAAAEAKVEHLAQFDDHRLGMICTVLLLNVSAEAQEAQEQMLAENGDLPGLLARGPLPPFRAGHRRQTLARWWELNDPRDFDIRRAR